MSKKVYFTQKQLNEIMGMTSGAYLNDASTGSEYNPEGIPQTDHEVISTEPKGNPQTLDHYGNEVRPDHPWISPGTGVGGGLYEDRKKKLNERNSELDGKKIFSLPQEVRAYANQGGQHNEIMSRIQSGEKMDLPSLYRLRNELQDSPNKKVTSAINATIKRAQSQGATLRDVHNKTTDPGLTRPKTGMPEKGHRKNTPTIHYENNQ